jgi:hypothetical protein
MRIFKDYSVDVDFSCRDTVDGICPPVRNVSECIAACKTSNDCGFGIYSNEGTCYPIRSSLRAEVNPAYRMTKRNGYTTFLDTRIFPYPPDQANRVFFYDMVQFRNARTGKILNPKLQLLPPRPFETHSVMKFVPIQKHDRVVLKDVASSLILRPGMEWIKHITYDIPSYDTFMFLPVDGKDLSYNSRFYLTTTYGANICPLTENLDDALVTGTPCEFEILPENSVFVCENGKCLEVPRSETKPYGDYGLRYHGRPVYRRNDCFFQCT